MMTMQPKRKPTQPVQSTNEHTPCDGADGVHGDHRAGRNFSGMTLPVTLPVSSGGVQVM